MVAAKEATTTTLPPGIENQPTELPDSLSDAASIAANVSFFIILLYDSYYVSEVWGLHTLSRRT